MLYFCGRGLPAREFGGEFGEQVAGAPAARLRERRGVVGQRGRGGRPVVGGRAAVAELPPVEGAATRRAPRETQPVRGRGITDAVSGRHGVPLSSSGRHRDATAETRHRG